MLGYGANVIGDKTVLIKIVDSAGKQVSGFHAPADNPEPFARDRADDFAIATGKPHQAVIIK